MKDEKALSRRTFMQRLSVLGTVGLGAGSLLAACGDEPDANAEADTALLDGANPSTADAGFDCTDTSGLTEQEILTRQNLNYVDDSPVEDKLCNNCQFWQPDAPIEGPCGGCQILKGPIHPEGYCDSWVAQQA